MAKCLQVFTSVYVRVPKKRWELVHYNTGGATIRGWLMKSISYLYQWHQDNEYYWPFVSKAVVRKQQLYDGFKMGWMPFSRWNPWMGPGTVRLTLPVRDCDVATQILEYELGITWTEFIRDRVEDTILSNQEYVYKREYWRKREKRQTYEEPEIWRRGLPNKAIGGDK